MFRQERPKDNALAVGYEPQFRPVPSHLRALNLRPVGIELPALPLTRRKHPLQRQRRSLHRNVFALAGGAIVPSERQVQCQQIDAEIARDRPRAQHQEKAANNDAHNGEGDDEDVERWTCQRTVRAKQRAVCHVLLKLWIPMRHRLCLAISNERHVKALAPAKAKMTPPKTAQDKAAGSRRKRRNRPSRLKPEQRIAFFERLSAANPRPETELAYTNPFTLLVAVVLSAQATDVGVNKATKALFATADTPSAMLALGEETVREHIKTIGLYRNKAKNVIALCRALIDEHNGAVPQEREALEKLPGVGRKTANVVLNTAFGQPTIAVDTHIFRVSNRTGLAPGDDVVAVELNLERLVPDAFKLDCHHWLILHGRYVCQARKPKCFECTVADLCAFKDKTPPPSEAARAKSSITQAAGDAKTGAP